MCDIFFNLNNENDYKEKEYDRMNSGNVNASGQ